MSENQSANQRLSGGLGLSQNEWEQFHYRSDLNYSVVGTAYEGGYDVVFQEGKVWSIQRQWSSEEAVTPEVAEAESKNLIPADSQLIETYHPAGRPETVVHLYRSEWLKPRFSAESSGDFTVQYNAGNQGVSRLVITLGNNP